jgi:hypothetical protein
MIPTPWIVCQIGAREHYAVARALQTAGVLENLVSDFWVPPGSAFGKLPGGQRLKDRHHYDLPDAKVAAFNARMLAFELWMRAQKKSGWEATFARNDLFQRQTIEFLRSEQNQRRRIFSYSYAALEIFRFSKHRGWKTVLGQIDPGPEEERIVAKEHERYAHLASHWQPVPESYWENWREEISLADQVVVNSEWSRNCLIQEGIAAANIKVFPLVYPSVPVEKRLFTTDVRKPLRLLFLGQVNLRKGIGRLLDAMRLIKDHNIQLSLVGPSEISANAWADLPNVTWTGPVPRSVVGSYYDEADVFILPTLSDGYALTQLEALARGVPVLASKFCGAAVESGVNGWLLDDLEPETIAQTLVATHEGRRNLTGPISPPPYSLKSLSEDLITLS